MSGDLVLPAPLPRLGARLEDQDAVVLAGMMVFGEARNQPMRAKIAVAQVAHNRLKYPREFGQDIKSVILRPYAYSCFLQNDPNYQKLFEPTKYEAPRIWEECYSAAYLVANGSIQDCTRGAVFYHDSSLPGPPHKPDGSCAWGSVSETAVIGNLIFYREANAVSGSNS